MKLSIAIADTNALPSAFVVYRGFEKFIPKAAALGYHGVELALKRADEINVPMLESLLGDNNLEVSCISTGQVYADGGLCMTHENPDKRLEVKKILMDLVDLAGKFGKTVNIGRVRGPIGNKKREDVEELFCEMARDICDYAQNKGVTMLLEPVNRYEIDFLNTVEEGVELMKKIDRRNMMLMPDLFHMNIEDRAIGSELSANIDYIKYIHFADSNRLAPGQGHTNFDDIMNELLKAEYEGWISVEILPEPDPDTAARQAAEFLLPMIREYNKKIQQRDFANMVSIKAK